MKLEGFADVMVKTIFDVNNLTSLYQMNVTEFLLEHGYAIRTPEEVHVEVMVKIDGNTVYCKYLNQTSFIEILYGKLGCVNIMSSVVRRFKNVL